MIKKEFQITPTSCAQNNTFVQKAPTHQLLVLMALGLRKKDSRRSTNVFNARKGRTAKKAYSMSVQVASIAKQAQQSPRLALQDITALSMTSRNTYVPKENIVLLKHKVT